MSKITYVNMVIISRPDKPNSFTKLQQSYKRLQGLQYLTVKLSEAVTREQVARVILHEGLHVLKANTGEIDLIRTDKKDTFEVIALKGYSKTFFKRIEASKGPLVTEIVIQTKKPFFITDVKKLEEKYKIAKLFITGVGASSAALLPLIINNEVIGILQFTFKTGAALNKEDKKFMMILAGQCAQAFERVTAQENLRNSKEQLEVILKNISDGIIVQDKSKKIIYANDAVTRYLEPHKYASFKEMYFDYLKRFYFYDEVGHTLDIRKLFAARAFAGEKNPTAVMQMVDKVTGTSFWINTASSTIYDTKNVPQQVVTIIHDITREKDIEQRKDDFISMASHELKTPLTTLKVFTQTFKKYFADEKSVKLLDKMDDQVSRLTYIVTELLDITKIKQGKLDAYTSKFNISDLIGEITSDMQFITHHQLCLQISPEIYVVADRDRISQVVTNFISNAIKYSPDGKKIDVSAMVQNNHLIFSVKDYGIGISKDNQDKVFERFYRAEDEQKTYPGLGLGLYISSEIIKQHKGKIWVDSEVGKGATFSFSIPLS